MKKHIIALCTVLLLAGCQTAGTDQTVYTVSEINEKGTELVSSVQKKDVLVEGVIKGDTLEDENALAGILVSDETTSDTIYCYFDGPDTRSMYEENRKPGDRVSMTVWLFNGGSKEQPSYYGIIVDLK
ncbi:MAG: membrane lipoprotein lipid attachment site-containing protein [Bulleidia sp.]